MMETADDGKVATMAGNSALFFEAWREKDPKDVETTVKMMMRAEALKLLLRGPSCLKDAVAVADSRMPYELFPGE